MKQSEIDQLAHTLAEEAARATLASLAPWPEVDPNYSGLWYNTSNLAEPEPVNQALRYLQLAGLLLWHPLHEHLVQVRPRAVFEVRPQPFQGKPAWQLTGDTLHPGGQIYDDPELAVRFVEGRSRHLPSLVTIHRPGEPVETRTFPTPFATALHHS